MNTVKKLLPLALAASLAVMVSCASAPKTPVLSDNGSTSTSTTTTIQQAAQVAPVDSAPAQTTVKAEEKPSITETEIRNLFGSANAAYAEADEFDIDTVLPERYAAAEKDFLALREAYYAVVNASPTYDGTAAWPLKSPLENAAATWNKLTDDGLPLLAEGERNRGLDARFRAQSAGAESLVAERFQAGDDYFRQADLALDSNGGRSGMIAAMSGYRQATQVFGNAGERAPVTAARDLVYERGYGRFAPQAFEAAEQKVKEDDAAYEAGDYAAGNAALKAALPLYNEVIARGLAGKTDEARSKAAQSKSQADGINAAVNAPAKYADAESLLGQADDALSSKSYESATALYGDASGGYLSAYDEAFDLKTKAEGEYASAEQVVAASKAKADQAGLGDNEYIRSALLSMDASKSELEAATFQDSIFDSAKARKSAALSDAYVDRILAERAVKVEEEKKVEAAKVEEARVEAAKVEEAKVEAAKVEAAKVEEARVEAAKVEAAKAEPPAPVEAAKPEEPKAVEAPKIEAPKVEAPAPVVAVKAEEPKPAAPKEIDLNAEAAARIAKAAEKQAWARSVNAVNNYPEKYVEGSFLLDSAKLSLMHEDPKAAIEKATAAYDVFAGIPEFAALPAEYTVRLIPARRDCLWRIAEYGFVYNNPLKWPVLYEANKKTFRDPNNPDLIYPNQIIKIPSIKGEKRSGMWDQSKTYKPLAK